MEPTLLTEAQLDRQIAGALADCHAAQDEQLHAAYRAACEAAATYAEVREADRIYQAALDALKGGAR